MTSKLIPIRVPLIDSLNLSFELDKIRIVDQKVISGVSYVYEATGEIEDIVRPPKPFVWTENGITLRFWVTNIPIYDSLTETKIKTKFLNITMSAKLLKQRYFEGISKENILTYYNNLMDLNVVRMSYQQFKHGHVKDIDICVNDRLIPSYFSELLLALKVNTRSSKKDLVQMGIEVDNMMISWNTRDKAKNLSPYFKIYYKEYELLSKKSLPFYTQFLQDELYNHGDTITGLIRAEFTIRNYSHKKHILSKEHYKEMPRTLGDLVNLSHDELYNIVCKEGLPNYLENYQPRLKVDLTPTDTVIVQMMLKLIGHGESKLSIFEVLDSIKGKNDNCTAVQKSRMTSKFNQLWETITKNKEVQRKLSINTSIHNFLKQTLNYDSRN